MAYLTLNLKSKRELKKALLQGIEVRLFSPGIGKPKDNGIEYVEGPHWPDAHRWYARVVMSGGLVKSVL